MSKVDYLQSKVDMATQAIEKIKSTIERHKIQLEKKKEILAKKLQTSIDNIKSYKWNKEGKGSEVYWEICAIESKILDIENASDKLKERERILQNCIQKLNLEIKKQLFIQNEIPEVLKNFMEEWKSSTYKYFNQRLNEYQKLKIEIDQEIYIAELDYIKSSEIFNQQVIEDGSVPNYQFIKRQLIGNDDFKTFMKNKKLDSKSLNIRKKNFAGIIVMKLDTFHSEKEMLIWLETTLEEEKQRKLLDIMNRVNHIVGKITDAKKLNVAAGNLNGYIIGQKGKVKVETIGAGGYNIQTYHFRTLIQTIKGESL